MVAAWPCHPDQNKGDIITINLRPSARLWFDLFAEGHGLCHPDQNKGAIITIGLRLSARFWFGLFVEEHGFAT